MDNAEVGQRADASAVRTVSRANLRDIVRRWTDSIRAYYYARDATEILNIPSPEMGNLQSDGKKKTKKSREATASVGAAGNNEDSRDKVHDKLSKSLNDLEDRPIRVAFEKVQTPAKRQAPPPPKTQNVAEAQTAQPEPRDEIAKVPIKSDERKIPDKEEQKEEIENSLPPESPLSIEASVPQIAATSAPETIVDSTVSSAVPALGVLPYPTTGPPLLVTDSWRRANIVPTEIPTPPSQESSSDSVFTDPEDMVADSAASRQHQQRQKTHNDNLTSPVIRTSSARSKNARSTDKNGEKFDKSGCRSSPSHFTVSRHRKIELSPASPRLGSTTTNLDPNQRRYSATEASSNGSTVLRRVASFTLDRATLDSKITYPKPRYVGGNLDHKLQEKFDGQHLVNWLASGIPENLRNQLSDADLMKFSSSFCAHLMSVGVLKPLDDRGSTKNIIFAPEQTYRWTNPDPPSKIIPIKLNIESPNRNGCPPNSSEYLKNLEDELSKLRKEVSRLRKLVDDNEAQMATKQSQTSPSESLYPRSKTKITSSPMPKNEETSSPVRESSFESGRFSASLSPIHPEKLNSFSSEDSRIELQMPSNLSSISEVDKDSSSPDKPRSDQDMIDDSIAKLSKKSMNDLQEHAIKENDSIVSKKESKESGKGDLDTNRNRHDTAGVKTHSSSSAPPSPPPMPEDMTPCAISASPVCENGIPPNPPISGMGISTQAAKTVNPLPSMSAMGIPPPPPPPMPGMGIPPPPPPMSGMGIPPPPPPMPGMGIPPPPPPMAGMGIPPPPPPMMGLGCPPPPPPMPGMGCPPPPPPMMGMGGPPPPPPMTGMGGPPPPPPMMGGHPPPLPAPPLGGWNPPAKPAMRKPPLSLDVPMKPLYWTRILIPESPPANPLWAEIEEERNVNLKEFIDLFSRQVVERKPTIKKEETDKPSKIQPAKILDSKRSKNVGILEKSLRVDFSEVENAVFNLDTSIVSLEALQQIYEIMPTTKELEEIASHEKEHPEIPLDRPELFLKQLSTIRHFTERIACMMFQNEFNDAISTVSTKLTNLRLTCDFLCNSQSLKRVMALILTLGNYMNGGNRMRGQADGFGLEILGKLKDVKSKVPGVTLLHFVVRARLNQEGDYPLDEQIPLPVPEPGDVEAAATINFEEITKELDRLEKELQKCRKNSAIVTEADPENSEPFKEKMEAFLKRSSSELANERECFQEARAKFKEVMQFYQFVPKGATIDTADPKDFFLLWLSFCKDFKDIWNKEQQRIRKEKLEMIRIKLLSRRKVETIPLVPGGLKDRIRKLVAKNKAKE